MSLQTTIPPEWEEDIGEVVKTIKRESLDPFDILRPPHESPPLLIGVVRGPLASGKTRVLPPAINEALVRERADTLVVHLSTQLEIGYLNATDDGRHPNGGFPIYRDSYDGFMRTLRINSETMSDEIAPDERGHSWLQGGILPPKVTILVEEDKSLTAEFCLLLVELLGWADAAARGSLPLAFEAISIFVIGCSDTDSVVWPFLDSAAQAMQAPLPVPSWTLCRPPSQGQYVVSDQNLDEDLGRVAQQVSGSFFVASAAPQKLAVVCFPPWERAERLRGPKKDVQKIDSFTILEDLDHVFTSDYSPPALKIICLPHGFRAPVQLKGFNRVVVFGSPLIEKRITDARTGRIVMAPLRTSKYDEVEEASWAYRSDCPANAVTVYRGTADRPIAKNAERRTKINGEHQAGFFAALSNSQFRSSSIARCAAEMFFVFSGFRDDCLKQLRQMRICRVSPGFEFGGGAEVGDAARSAFYELLPIFDYDPRLALFAALPSSDPKVAVIKIQLAALVKVGLGHIFKFHAKSEDVNTKAKRVELRRRLANDLRGYTRRMASHGSLWTLLALWKSAAIESGSFVTDDAALASSGSLQVGEGLVGITFRESRHVIDLMSTVSQVLAAHHGVQAQPTNFDEEKHEEFTFRHYEELHKHLLQCFIHSAVLAAPAPEDESAGESQRAEEMDFYDMRSYKTVCGSVWVSLVDFDFVERIQKQKCPQHNGKLFGISLEAHKLPGEPFIRVMDWLWIHPSRVAEWFRIAGNGQRAQETFQHVAGLGENMDVL
ncbi:hypothetical protein J3458_019049 [Metarhizium acridum]|uniref:uncharacterized protein n=1 Tax=Metarhizium acridum TaxID=92637 RepID=UPI001C6B601C|nr:hypothetical protein J3458_019049 [Metarhizium acridum]